MKLKLSAKLKILDPYSKAKYDTILISKAIFNLQLDPYSKAKYDTMDFGYIKSNDRLDSYSKAKYDRIQS